VAIEIGQSAAYSSVVSRAIANMARWDPIASELVAAGDGALRTWMTRSR
jgi:hypothetical protein